MTKTKTKPKPKPKLKPTCTGRRRTATLAAPAPAPHLQPKRHNNSNPPHRDRDAAATFDTPQTHHVADLQATTPDLKQRTLTTWLNTIPPAPPFTNRKNISRRILPARTSRRLVSYNFELLDSESSSSEQEHRSFPSPSQRPANTSRRSAGDVDDYEQYLSTDSEAEEDVRI